MSNVQREVALQMAEAAIAFLDALDPTQRDLVVRSFDDVEERERWFYTPTDHGGLPIAAMRPAQERLALKFVRTGTSKAGYVTIAAIMGLDNILDEEEGWWTMWGRERGRDPELYYVRIFGDPATDTWAWRFGGHHVSVNHVIANGEVISTTPYFLGADPANSPLLGPHLLRPLGSAEDLGRELVRSLNEQQMPRAVLTPVAPADLVSANRPRYGHGDGDLPLPLREVWRGYFADGLDAKVRAIQANAEATAGITPDTLEAVRLSTNDQKGISAKDLAGEQRDLLRAVLDVYLYRIPDALADVEAAKFADEAGLDALSFAWAGGLESGEGHYYRVQGPSLLAEYDNTQRGANHIHTVWRDPRLDLGGDALRDHYDHAHWRH
ncbi:MAG: DUF3500 domain-containing protein [Acidimicrobiia bacterium]